MPAWGFCRHETARDQTCAPLTRLTFRYGTHVGLLIPGQKAPKTAPDFRGLAGNFGRDCAGTENRELLGCTRKSYSLTVVIELFILIARLAEQPAREEA
jgi:hypothetical protein